MSHSQDGWSLFALMLYFGVRVEVLAVQGPGVIKP
jgi:hypothetical protein